MPYTFQSMKNMGKLTDSNKLYNSIESFLDYGSQFPFICGKIEALFGQPVYKTENLENPFSYCVLVVSEEAGEIYLNIYCAGPGLAIGGMSDEKSKKAAKTSVDYVRQAEPINYVYRAYYLDGPTALELGIGDDAPYYNETELRLSEKEFRELYACLL